MKKLKNMKKLKKETKKVKPNIKQEFVKIDGEDKIKTTYPDGTIEYRIL